MKHAFTQFSGIRPRIDPRLLPDGAAQKADNVWTAHGGLSPLAGTRDVLTLGKTGVKTIYRFGQALASETNYWFAFTTDVDVVKGAVADDTEERTYWTGDGAPKYTTAALGTAGGNLPSGYRALGVAPPETGPSAAVSGVSDAGAETRIYVYTFVTDKGEESEPSPPTTVNLLVGQTVTLSNMATANANSAVLAYKRVYRAQAGRYLFVTQVDITTTTAVDNLASANLGEVCPSIGWTMPPATLYGLTAGPNGNMIALDGYTARFCEPYRPHAWPSKYSQTLNYPTVGCAAFGQGYLVLTTGLPSILAGTSPASMSVAEQSFYQPCVAKRSIVSIGTDVIWASPDGLVAFGAGGNQILTEDLFTPEDWRALNPATLVGEWHEGNYVGSYNPGSGRRMFMLDFSKREWIDLPTLGATAMFRDTVGDALYLAIGDHIHKFRAGALLPYTWRSPKVTTPLSDFVAARVTGDYPVTFRYLMDGVLRLTKTVTSDEPFKLPARLARTFEVELAGTSAVLGVVLSSTESDI